jgi:WD40 repeat protein
MKIWNLASKSCVYEEPDRKVSYGIDYVVFDKAANQLIAVANDQNIIIYDAATMNIKQTVVGFNDEIVDMKFLTNTEVAVATNSEQVRIFSLPNFGVRVLGQGDSTAQHSDTVLALATSHDGKYIVSASKDQRLIVWEVATGKSKAVLTGHAGDVSAVTFFRQNHRYIISAGRDLTWKLWDIKAAIEHEGGTPRGR